MLKNNKKEKKQYHTVVTFPKSNRIIVERDKIDTLNYT
jgi:hypothetical protein